MSRADDKLRSLVGLAVRSRSVTLGREACKRAARRGELYALLVAVDAGASAVRDSGGAGEVLLLDAGLDKRGLGALAGRDELSTLGITDPQIASGLAQHVRRLQEP